MRIRFWDRFLLAVSGLLVFCLGGALLAYAFGFSFANVIIPTKADFALWEQMAAIGIAFLLCVLGVHGISMLFRRRRDKGFIMQHTDLGDVSISMQAMENMIKRCIDSRDEMKVTRTSIYRARDGVNVGIRVSLANGVNIPLTVNTLQKQIKHYITSCSGVDVKEVRVMVETSSHQHAKDGEVIVPNLQNNGVAAQTATEAAAPVAAEDSAEIEKEPVHQRIFKREETECSLPCPPAEEAEQAEEGLPAEETEDTETFWEGLQGSAEQDESVNESTAAEPQSETEGI